MKPQCSLSQSLSGGPGAKEPPRNHQLPQVVGGVVERQEQLAEVRLIGAVRRDGDEIDPSVSRQFLELFAILADGRDAPLPGLRVGRFMEPGRWLVAKQPQRQTNGPFYRNRTCTFDRYYRDKVRKDRSPGMLWSAPSSSGAPRRG
jgi:hypothetical protein